MTLSSGRLGPYEVLGPLGAGGMGEVYRARDPRLGREIALKVLPAELSSDAGRLKRFEKEARSASALNHPNIVTIYEIGTADSISYIAMELVEGKTLRELLFAGPVPVKRILQVAAQVADGLARAHEAGIVHRDLKPENVMVSKDGRVKILDFGLAKLTYSGTGSDEGTNLPTETGTGAGVVLGTVGYMSPEQASGQPVDFRSDQFSFGSILYEMVTGKRAFRKKTGVETLSAIVRDDPEPIGQIHPNAPAPLRWTIERCLAKDPEDRYASTKDLARELFSFRDRLSSGDLSEVEVSPTTPRQRSRLLPAAIAVAFAAVAAGALLLGRHLGEQPRLSFRQLTFRRGYVGSARFAPDGQTIVFTAQWEGGRNELHTTRIGSPESLALGLRGVLFSVSSLGQIALAKGGTLAVVPLGGGAPRERLENVREADWSPDGRKLAVIHVVKEKYRLEYPIGTLLYETANRIDNIHVSRGGDQIAFRELSGDDLASGALAVVDAAGRKKSLGLRTSEFGWSPDGEELWFLNQEPERRESELRAVDLKGRQRSITRLPGVFQLDDLSRDGRLLLDHLYERGEIRCLPPGEMRERSLSWLDFSWAADLSVDGKTLLIDEFKRGAVYLRKTDGSPAVRLGDGKALSLSPDGSWALALQRGEPPHLILLATRAGETRILENKRFESFGAANWLPDGRRILFGAVERGHRSRLYVQNVQTGRVVPLTPEGVSPLFWFPVRAVSPDGKWVFAQANEAVLYPVGGGPDSAALPIRGLEDGDAPIGWAADSRSLFIQDDGENPAKVYRLDLSSGRRQLFREFSPTDPAGIRASIVHVTPDGRSWAYTYLQSLSDLYLAEGLK